MLGYQTASVLVSEASCWVVTPTKSSLSVVKSVNTTEGDEVKKGIT